MFTYKTKDGYLILVPDTGRWIYHRFDRLFKHTGSGHTKDGYPDVDDALRELEPGADPCDMETLLENILFMQFYAENEDELFVKEEVSDIAKHLEHDLTNDEIWLDSEFIYDTIDGNTIGIYDKDRIFDQFYSDVTGTYSVFLKYMTREDLKCDFRERYGKEPEDVYATENAILKRLDEQFPPKRIFELISENQRYTEIGTRLLKRLEDNGKEKEKTHGL